MKVRIFIVLAAGLLLGAVLWPVLRQKSPITPPPAARQAPLPKAFSVASTNGIHRAVAKPALDSIPARCAVILGQEDGVSFNARYAALKQLRPPLASNEVQALYAQLRKLRNPILRLKARGFHHPQWRHLIQQCVTN